MRCKPAIAIQETYGDATSVKDAFKREGVESLVPYRSMAGEELPSPNLRGELATAERENLRKGSAELQFGRILVRMTELQINLAGFKSPLRPQKKDHQRKLAEEAHAV